MDHYVHLDSQDDRIQALAEILAAGILRLHARAALIAFDDEHSASGKTTDSDQVSLEVSKQTVLTVHVG